MWFEDLQPWSYLPVETKLPLLAVGWLERGKPYPKGKPDADTRAALRVLYTLDESTGLHRYDTSCFFAGGFHPCDLCEPGGRVTPEARGYSNFFVRTEREIFVCNDLIQHYVEEHSYAPPRQFIEVLLKEPAPVVLNRGGMEAIRAERRKINWRS